MKKNLNFLLITILLVSLTIPSWGQIPFNKQSKGRIAISSDGNFWDSDDFGATAASLALLAKAELQDKLVLYTYADHIWGSENNRMPQVEESALGGRDRFKFTNADFIPAVTNPEVAYNAMRDEINASSSNNPLIIVCAGPMQVAGTALDRAQPSKRQYVTLISHSYWNNHHSDKPELSRESSHSGWTWDKMKNAFTNVNFIKIRDQNEETSSSLGFNTERAGPGGSRDWASWHWMRDSNDENVRWLYSRAQAVGRPDISDCGMIWYLIHNDENGGPQKMKNYIGNGISVGNGNGGGCNTTEVVTPSEDLYLQGADRFNNGDLRIESGKRVSYLKFQVPSVSKPLETVKLELTVSSDSGNGLIEVFKGTSNNWTETNLSNNNKPGEGVKLGSLNTTYSKNQSYQWELSGVTPGETISLIVKQTGGNDVSFSSKEGVKAPRLILKLRCNDNDINKAISIPGILEAENFDTQKGLQVENTSDIGGGQNIGYIENGDSATYKINVNKSGEYEVITRVASNTAGGKIIIKAKQSKVGEIPVTNSGGWQSWIDVKTSINLTKGEQTLKLDFSGGNGYLFNINKLSFKEQDNTGDGNKTCIAVEKNGIVAVEAEHFEGQSKDENRRWYTFDSNTTGTPGPDPDPNHSDNASGNKYLEILPDTRVTHGDPLTAESFSDQPGKTTIIDYKIKFTTSGKYFVWVRAHSTGTEDNGVHVGINGTWPASGQKMQWCEGKNKWTWESKQRTGANHCGEPQKIFLNIPSPGIHTISFSMREDGFEMDKFVLSKAYSKPSGLGPEMVLEDCMDNITSDTNFENINTRKVKVFPNPGKDFISVSGVKSGESIEIYDFYGSKVKTVIISNKNASIDISELKSGLYIISIQGSDKIQFIKK
ncbi:carbohydrate-binding protein [Aquimarina algiphila]|uniref:carbohydrate-binding protein n=1 Tax=Aquimarina algiphila TaxID=2047982 RepID=UPI00232C2DD1|nr:carbohydrate-binding protein [Aquimarina algiphila]